MEKLIGTAVRVSSIVPQVYEDITYQIAEQNYMGLYIGRVGRLLSVDLDKDFPNVLQFDEPIAGRLGVHTQRFRDIEINVLY